MRSPSQDHADAGSLTYALLGSKRYAILTSLLFLIPPSQPTLNAVPYTEPFAALCTFLGMYLYVTRQWAAAAGAWAFGSGFRAQGIVLGAGFFGWEFVLGAWSAGRLSVRVGQSLSSSTAILIE